MSVHLALIWAQAENGAIGRDGTMPWHLPEDLAQFKAVTLGAPVVMGRRTWESLPERFRPLAGRENVVVTRDRDYEAPGARTTGSLEAAVAALESEGTELAWIIGGGQLYREAMPIADELAITRIALDIDDADTFAPQLGPEWRLADPGVDLVSKTGIGYRFERWLRLRQIP